MEDLSQRRQKMEYRLKEISAIYNDLVKDYKANPSPLGREEILKLKTYLERIKAGFAVIAKEEFDIEQKKLADEDSEKLRLETIERRIRQAEEHRLNVEAKKRNEEIGNKLRAEIKYREVEKELMGKEDKPETQRKAIIGKHSNIYFAPIEVRKVMEYDSFIRNAKWNLKQENRHWSEKPLKIWSDLTETLDEINKKPMTPELNELKEQYEKRIEELRMPYVIAELFKILTETKNMIKNPTKYAGGGDDTTKKGIAKRDATIAEATIKKKETEDLIRKNATKEEQRIAIDYIKQSTILKKGKLEV